MFVYDLIDQQCVLNSRQTDIQTVQPMDDKKNLCAWSAPYFAMDFISTLMSYCRETWAGDDMARMEGGRGWGPVASMGL
jgi:hypothetical protein